MAGTVILHVEDKVGPERAIVFQNRALWTVGRASDCCLRLPHPEISRRHCLLDIDPPHVHIRDLGSRNRTYVNGAPIGRRTLDQRPEDANAVEIPDYDLQQGDEVRIGAALIRITIDEPVDMPAGCEREGLPARLSSKVG